MFARPLHLWWLSATAFAGLLSFADAASFYVSPGGRDDASGAIGAPFGTIQAGINHLTAGDVLYVRGGAYHETVVASRSGTRDAPITIQSYPGETAVLFGSRPVSGPWSVHAGAIYQAAWPSQPSQVFCDGRLLNEARWPNSPLPADLRDQVSARADDGGTTFVVSSSLPAVDLTGAWLQILSGQSWVGFSRQISAYDRATGRLTLAAPIDQLAALQPRRGNRFFIFGKLELLDAPGEWWWDATARQLYVWPPDGTAPDGRIEAGNADATLTLANQSYIAVKGIAASGGWFNLQNCTGCSIENCDLYAPTWIRTYDGYAISPPLLGGIDLSGTNNVISGGSVRLSGRSGIHDAGAGTLVQNVLVEDAGWNWTNNVGVDCSSATGATIEYSTIRRTAGSGVTPSPASHVIDNRVEQSALIFEDCGNIGVFGMDGNGAEIADNIVTGNHCRWGAGIYLDGGSNHFFVHDNYVDDVSWNGINITGPNQIEHNTLVGMQHQGLNMAPLPINAGTDMSAGIVAHNLSPEPFPIRVSLGQPVSLVPESAAFGAYAPLGPSGRRVEVDWADMVQPGWSQREVPLDLSVVNSLSFWFESPATQFAYTISHVRLLPANATGDDGAVPIGNATAFASSDGGSTCAITAAGDGSWTVTGANAFRGTNNAALALAPTLMDLRAYRGVAFELSGNATRTYQFQGYQDVDNGPEPLASRGATLPAEVGAPAGPPSRVTSVPPLPAFLWATFATGTSSTSDLGVPPTPGLTFSADGLPTWASIDPTSGRITGTPPVGATSPMQATLRVTNGIGASSSSTVNLLVGNAGADARIVNLSARGQVVSGAQILVAGFVVAGPEGRSVLIRAAGPALQNFEVAGALADPRVTVAQIGNGGADVLATNADWSAGTNGGEIAATAASVGAFAFAPRSRDAALLMSLPGGGYTATIDSPSGGSGVALVELYDASAGDSGRLVNLSTRAAVGAGDNLLILGTSVSGSGAVRLLIRAVGPGLGAFGLQQEALADPEIKLLSGSTVIASNDDWEIGNSSADIRAASLGVGAFSLAPGSKDAALLVKLTPGAYSIHVSGKNGTTGIALAELYVIEP